MKDTFEITSPFITFYLQITPTADQEKNNSIIRSKHMLTSGLVYPTKYIQSDTVLIFTVVKIKCILQRMREPNKVHCQSKEARYFYFEVYTIF